MPIALTEQQREILDAPGEKPPSVIDPRARTAYVLVRAEDYEAIREAMEDERRLRIVHKIASRNAAGRMGEEPWSGA